MLFKFQVVVKDDERAFLTRDGRFERLLGPGRFTAFDYGRRLAAEVVKVVRTEIAADKALLIARTHPDVAAEHFEIVQTEPTEVAIVSLDGEPKHQVLPNTTRAFWKTVTRVAVERIDAGADVRVGKRHLDKLDLWRVPLIVQRRGRGARGGPPVRRRQAHGAAAGGPARLLGGGPHREDRQGRHPSDAPGGDGAGDPDQGPRRHPRDADGVHPRGGPGEGGAGGRRRVEHGLPSRAVRHPRGGGDAHAGRDPGGARHHRPRGAGVRHRSGRRTSAWRSARSASRT